MKTRTPLLLVGTGLLAAVGLLAAIPAAQAQWAVYDAKADGNQMLNHLQDMTKYAEMANNQVQQIEKATQTLNQLKAYVRASGNAAQIVNVVGKASAVDELRGRGVGQTVSSLGRQADGAAAWQDNGQGLYRAVRTATPSGETIARKPEGYRRYDAVGRTVHNYQAVQDDTLARIRALRVAMRQTLNRLDSATTQTEVSKLHGVLAAQSSALNDLHAEQAAAGQQAAVQRLENDNNAQMKRQAAADEFAASFNGAADKFNGGGGNP